MAEKIQLLLLWLRASQEIVNYQMIKHAKIQMSLEKCHVLWMQAEVVRNVINVASQFAGFVLDTYKPNKIENIKCITGSN